MKRYVWFLWIIGLMTIYCFSQKVNIDELDKKGGLYYKKESGILFSGNAIKLDPDGVVLENIPILNGLINGTWIVNNDEGQKVGEGTFKNGSGVLYLYHNYDKITLLEETHYENNLRQGKSVRYFESGQPAQETFFDKDLLHGTDTILRENGTIVISQEWKHGMLDGKWLEYYETGEKEAEGTFKNGNGTLIRWYKNGAISEITPYKKSQLHGTSITWYQNGKKSSETHLKNGVAHGELIEWDENGNVTRDEFYKNGVFEYAKIQKR